MGFPLNVLIYLALPILLPTLLTMVLVRFTLASRSSRSRIRLLEKDESASERLVHVLASIERQMEDAVVDFMDDSSFGVDGRADEERGTQSASPTATVNAGDAPQNGHADAGDKHPRSQRPPGEGTGTGSSGDEDRDAKDAPRISAGQRRMIAALNTLPQLKKERAFIDNIRNAHGSIIARDVQTFEFHKIGWGVLRHWADHFVL
ncbi:hypothetical protein DENSPDRAFT_843656 [Dentipellis sp. KUC8613]|nr:hypothetical protein DENSPDRAFT_843656 [Dentipellis sp. KUC8613]